ncbi:multidrug effflux MFS transporter [Jatrophihabitans lederbergiae]|uniref:Multidrug effflux MFS transporter n=1 Tax=Jatrophihabitans lederbergiae TaxID=3075547 RepID=A0ABU2JGF7_9ACTN|nr:multidrug effflux MFS transporter [Jatrophihabitans sp. DSM 44399]MDT0264070.1 multidrug effflux MFS transporter [Jatrophihabitans sp. DSM 44399]
MSSAPSDRPGIARLILILGALVALGPLSIDAYVPGLPKLTRDLSASASGAQLTITACLLGLAVGQLLAGPLSDALGRRRPLLAGLALYTVAGLLCALASDVWALVALRLVQGIGGAFGLVIANAVVRDRTAGAAAARVFALLMLVAGVAPVLAPIAGGQLLRVTGWQGIFVALAALSGVILLVSLIGLPETLPPLRRRPGGMRAIRPVFTRLLADRVFVGYVLANGLAFAAMFAYISGSPYVLQEIHGLSPQAYSGVFAVNALGLVAAAQLSGRLVHRAGARALLATGLAGSAAGGVGVLLAAVTGPGLEPLLAALFVSVTSVGLVLPNAAALALQDHGEHAGAAAALLGFSQFLIGGTLAPLAGAAGTRTAIPMGVVMAVLGCLSLLAYLTLTRTPRHPTGTPDLGRLGAAAAAAADPRSRR